MRERPKKQKTNQNDRSWLAFRNHGGLLASRLGNQAVQVTKLSSRQVPILLVRLVLGQGEKALKKNKSSLLLDQIMLDFV